MVASLKRCPDTKLGLAAKFDVGTKLALAMKLALTTGY